MEIKVNNKLIKHIGNKQTTFNIALNKLKSVYGDNIVVHRFDYIHNKIFINDKYCGEVILNDRKKIFEWI